MEILIKDMIRKGTAMLEKAGVADYLNDSWLLSEYVFGVTRKDFYMNPEVRTDSVQADRYMALIRKRAEKIPLQHITGTQEFMGLPFKVNHDVLIPRQDTELLVEEAVKYIRTRSKERECLSENNNKISVLDMCTGSGCIAIAVDKLCRNVEVTAVDISYKAIAVAKENNSANNTDVKFILSNLFEEVQGKYDVIISNPPYIKTGEIDILMDEVKEHEPLIALDGDNDGLKFYKLIIRSLNNYLKDDGKIMFEIGYDQGKSVPEILKKYGFNDIKVIKDLSGNDRVVIAGKE